MILIDSSKLRIFHSYWIVLRHNKIYVNEVFINFFYLSALQLIESKNISFTIYNHRYKLCDSRLGLEQYRIPFIHIPYNIRLINSSDINQYIYNKVIIFVPKLDDVYIPNIYHYLCNKINCLFSSKELEDKINCCSNFFYSGLKVLYDTQIHKFINPTRLVVKYEFKSIKEIEAIQVRDINESKITFSNNIIANFFKWLFISNADIIFYH